MHATPTFARSLVARSSFPFFLSSSHPVSEVCGPEALFTSPTPLACRCRAYLGRSQPASALVSSSSDLSSPDSFLGVAHPPLHHAVNRRPIHPMFFLAPLPTMLIRSCHCFVTVCPGLDGWRSTLAAFPTTLYCSSLATSPAQSFSFFLRLFRCKGPLQGSISGPRRCAARLLVSAGRGAGGCL